MADGEQNAVGRIRERHGHGRFRELTEERKHQCRQRTLFGARPTDEREDKLRLVPCLAQKAVQRREERQREQRKHHVVGNERQLEHPVEIGEIGFACLWNHPVVRMLSLQLHLEERAARKEEVIFAVLLHPSGVRVDRPQIRVSRRSFHRVDDVFFHRARHIETAPRRELLAHPVHLAERGSRDAEFRKVVAVFISHENLVFASLLLAVVVDDLAGDARREVAELHEHLPVLGLFREPEAVVFDEIRLRVQLR